MSSLFRMLMGLPLLRPILRPITRLIVGLIAIPLFRLFLKRIVRLQDLDAELEKDLEQWFRAALVLLVATQNMESLLFGMPPDASVFRDVFLTGFRILLAVSVVEMMPDQELFAVIHPGPPALKWNRHVFSEIWLKRWAILKGIVCQHLNRSSPVFAILAATMPGWWTGWICYGIAVVQYLIIGLVTSRDKALDVLSQFDRAVAERRRELVEEFEISDADEKQSKRAGELSSETESADETDPPNDEEISKAG